MYMYNNLEFWMFIQAACQKILDYSEFRIRNLWNYLVKIGRKEDNNMILICVWISLLWSLFVLRYSQVILINEHARLIFLNFLFPLLSHNFSYFQGLVKIGRKEDNNMILICDRFLFYVILKSS